MLTTRIPLNELGRDFVVGDIHGAYDSLYHALSLVQFDPLVDRLFLTGDLVDRGSRSPESLALLSFPWAYSVRGNHEQMFLDMYEENDPPENILPYMCAYNGMSWWVDVPVSHRKLFLEAWAVLPYAIELETPRGLVGIIHGEVPAGMSWSQFTQALERKDAHVLKSCLWERTRTRFNNTEGVSGIGRVYSGHTIHDGVTQYGNVYMLDTGAVQGERGRDGHLTLIAAAARTTLLLDPQNAEANVVVKEDETLSTPFGVYTRE